MVGILINASGSTVPNIVVDQVLEGKVSRTVIHNLPTTNKDIIQEMGAKNRTYTIKGWAIQTGSSAVLATARNDLQYLVNRTGSLNSDIMTQTQVFFTGLVIDDRGGRSLEFRFSLNAVEVV